MRLPQSAGLRFRVVVGLLLGLCLAGCQSKEPPASYVARVGDHYLTSDDLDRMLGEMGPVPDTTAAWQQVIDQWQTRMLLYREAERLDLQSVEEVQQRLEQQRRSILVAALKTRLHDEADLTPSPSEVRTYFERHKEQLEIGRAHV